MNICHAYPVNECHAPIKWIKPSQSCGAGTFETKRGSVEESGLYTRPSILSITKFSHEHIVPLFLDITCTAAYFILSYMTGSPSRTLASSILCSQHPGLERTRGGRCQWHWRHPQSGHRYYDKYLYLQQILTCFTTNAAHTCLLKWIRWTG